MALHIYPAPEVSLSQRQVDAWKDIPVSIVSDELNRAQTMQAAVKPVIPGTGFAGLAVTVGCMVGDNLAPHHALQHAAPGSVIVIDARGHEDTALWGEILHRAATCRGVAGVVVDGAVRDLAALRQSKLPVFARAAVPAGPHKGFGGAINAPIQCGGVSVTPGDLVIGDDDGVVVVRPDQLEGLMDRCRKRMRREAEILDQVEQGVSTVALLGLPGPEDVQS